MDIHFTLPSKPIDTVAACNANAITKEYYNHLVGEINRGTVLKVVCYKYYAAYDYTTYHLISL